MPHDVDTVGFVFVFSQVPGTPAAAPRASGYMSAIPQFRWYQSQGYSTLRHICSSMRKSSNMTEESIYL